ncbi:GNAT family N-acetyltransferase [Cupriavidus sp. 8B]
MVVALVTAPSRRPPLGGPPVALQNVAALGETMIGCACGEQFDATFVVRAVGVLQGYREQQIATHLVGTLETISKRPRRGLLPRLLTFEHLNNWDQRDGRADH